MKRKILLIDDDENLLSAMAEFFEFAAGVKCLRFRRLSELVEKSAEVLAPEVIVAILDINLGAGEPSGIEAYHWLCDQGFRGKIVFLTGHAKDHPLVKRANEIQGVAVFEKPLTTERLLTLVEEKRDAPTRSQAG